MKIYRTKAGIVIENEGKFFLAKDEQWEPWINDDNIMQKARKAVANSTTGGSELIKELLAPIGSNQELWACGVTYLRSKIGRQEESKDAGGGRFLCEKYMKPKGRKYFLNPHHTA